jgi:hypothetical protein
MAKKKKKAIETITGMVSKFNKFLIGAALAAVAVIIDGVIGSIATIIVVGGLYELAIFIYNKVKK